MKKALTTLLLTFTVSAGNADDTAVNLAAYHGEEAKVIDLLKANPDVDARDSSGGTALHAAMFQDNVTIVKLLIEAGYDVNAVGPKNGYTPLHDAVWANNLPALKLLVENGGDVTVKGLDGNTPLAKAKAENKVEIVNYLESINHAQ